MNKREFLEKVWTEVFGCGNTRVDFDNQCLADTCVDGRKVTCDCVSCGEDGVKLHDATESEDMGWFIISDDIEIDEDSMENVLCSINFAVFSEKDGTDGEKSTSDSPWTLVSTFLPDVEPGKKMSPTVDVRFKDG